MIDISIKANVDQISKRLNALAAAQVPFATAMALNALAKQVVEAEKTNEAKVLDRPKPFTVNSVRMVRASKNRAEARVYMMDRAAQYLSPYEFGGVNKLNSRALLKPVGAKSSLDAFGNLPRNYIASLKGRSDIFIGKVKTKTGVVDGVWQRSSGPGGKATLTRTTKTGRVIVRKVTGLSLENAGGLKLLVKFEDAHQVNQRLNWFSVAQQIVAKQFNKEFGKALAKAIATQK